MKGLVPLILTVMAVATTRAAEKPPLNHPLMAVSNGCFVETVAFLDHWKQDKGGETWARMLQWGAKPEDEVPIGHAVAICESAGALWCWDINHGWRRLPADPGQRENVDVVAAPILAKYPKTTARYPTYRFDFPQAASATPPAAQPANPNHALRDASIVGAQLARTRPVNVVRFSHGSGEEKRESAAAVFVFHGRYCIYVPEIGTVPFRTRGSVENLQLIQQALRRMFPGVGAVRKL
ncbi:MAG: hypothetical protein Q7S40_04605 [Opitutaceae bacterium]|nr:hypothetical protein [Opitutaceae bacterium]